jgi:crotonobetainyl-CoA:carnitine CoA-transferase CaiB-like acyl-CoA transferase
LLEVVSVNGFEVYGDPGPKAAQTLAELGAKVFKVWRGIN